MLELSDVCDIPSFDDHDHDIDVALEADNLQFQDWWDYC